MLYTEKRLNANFVKPVFFFPKDGHILNIFIDLSIIYDPYRLS